MTSEVSSQSHASLQQRVTPWHRSDSKLFWVLLALSGELQPVHAAHNKLHIWKPFSFFHFIMPLWFYLVTILPLDVHCEMVIKICNFMLSLLRKKRQTFILCSSLIANIVSVLFIADFHNIHNIALTLHYILSNPKSIPNVSQLFVCSHLPKKKDT